MAPMMQRTAETTNKYGMRWTILTTCEDGGMRAECHRGGCDWWIEVRPWGDRDARRIWTDHVNGHTHR